MQMSMFVLTLHWVWQDFVEWYEITVSSRFDLVCVNILVMYMALYWLNNVRGT